MTTFNRISITDFELDQPHYAGGLVYAYEVDDDGVITSTLATLYADVSSTVELENPQRLNSRGRFDNPVYIATPVILEVQDIGSGNSHTTGIVGANLVGAILQDAQTAANQAQAFAEITRRLVAQLGRALISPFSYGLLALSNASQWQTGLGISSFIKLLLDDPDAATAQTTLGGTTVGKALFTAASDDAAIARLVSNGTDRTPALTSKTAIYAGTDGGAITLEKLLSVLPLRGYLAGLGVSRNATVTSLDIAAGIARDDANGDFMRLTSAITKSLNATWTAGNGGGLLDTGVKANNTTYHIFLIKNPSTGAVDVIGSLSPTTPSPMPSGFTMKRRIASRRTDGSGDWIKVIQHGDTCWLDVAVADITGVTNPGTSAVTRTLTSVPTGIQVEAIYTAVLQNTEASRTALYISSLDKSDQGAGGEIAQINGNANGDGTVMNVEGRVMTNTSAQIRTRLGFSGAGTILGIATHGWVDRRGRDD